MLATTFTAAALKVADIVCLTPVKCFTTVVNGSLNGLWHGVFDRYEIATLFCHN